MANPTVPQESAEERRDREAFWAMSGLLLVLAFIMLGLGLYFQLYKGHEPAPCSSAS